eukprot:2260419-Pyramimonas_sp.AAC.1
MNFSLSPQGRSDDLPARFDIPRNGARQAGELTIGCEGLTELLLRAAGRGEHPTRRGPAALKRGLPHERSAGVARDWPAVFFWAHGGGLAGQPRFGYSLDPAPRVPRGRARARADS